MVIDCLCDDRPALKACALTCHAWLPRTRHHIYRRITVKYDPDDDFEPTSPEPEYDLPPDEVGVYVEELRIFALPPPWEYDSYNVPLDSNAEGLRNGCRKLWSSLTYYTNLTRLNLIAFDWRYSPQEEAKFRTLVQNVTHLDLAQSNFRSLEHFLSLLATFPKMTSLSLTRVDWPEIEKPIDAPLRLGSPDDTQPRLVFPTTHTRPSLRKMRSFSFVGDGCTPYVVSAIAEWLQNNNDQLREDMEFAWSCICCTGLIHLPRVLSALGGALTHVELHIAGRTQFMEATQGMRHPIYNLEAVLTPNSVLAQGVSFLRENSSLRSILFFVSCSPPRDGEIYMDDPLGPLLSEVSSTEVRTIEFACCYQPNLPWTTNSATFTPKRIDEIISRSTYTNVSRLIFSFSYKFEDHQEQIIPLVERCLPQAVARGILRLEFGWTFKYL